MARAYSKDLRKKIVAAYELGSCTIEDVADQFSVSKSVVSKYLKLQRETGDLTPKKSSGRPSVLDEENLSVLKELILSFPEHRLRDYCAAFREKTGTKLSITTCWEASKILDIRRKKRVFTLQKEKR